MLGPQIRKLRLSCRMNQVELAEVLGVSKQSVSNWEHGNILPSVELLVKLSDYFGVSTDYLLGREVGECICVDGLPKDAVTHLRQIAEDIRGTVPRLE